MNRGEGERSDDRLPTEIEHPEQRERFRRIAANMVDMFGFNPRKESLLVVTDGEVVRQNNDLVEALRDELEERTSISPETNGNYEYIVARSSPRSAAPFGEEIGEKLRDRPVILLMSMSRSHSGETGAASRGDTEEKEQYARILRAMQGNESIQTELDPSRMLDEDTYAQGIASMAKRRRSRILSVTKGTNPFEIMTKGAVEEPIEKIRERIEALDGLMKDVRRVRITTADGTDISMDLRLDKKDVEDGNLRKPGSLSNYPIGEWSCAPWWDRADGRIVVSGPFGGKNAETGRWHNLDWVKDDGPITLDLHNGEIISINGKPVAEQRQSPVTPLIASFLAYLDAGNNEKNDAYRIAELGIGVNASACKEKPDEHWGSTETEKKYGTVHIAVGSNGTFGIDRTDKNFSTASIHSDMVLIDRGLNVECERVDGSSFTLIREGEPQGY